MMINILNSVIGINRFPHANRYAENRSLLLNALKITPFPPKKLLVSLILGLTVLTQACGNTEPASRDVSSDDVETTYVQETTAPSDANPDRDNAPAAQAPEPKVITKEVVVVAKPLDALPAELDSKNPNSKINIRVKPSTQSQARHFGYATDPIRVFKEADLEDGFTWYFVEFVKSKAQGWVRGDFVRFVEDFEGQYAEFEGQSVEDVIPIDYSGTYVRITKDDPSGASIIFRQNAKNLDFTVSHSNAICPRTVGGSADFVPESNRFIGSTNDGQFQLTLIPIFSDGEYSEAIDIETFDPVAQIPLTPGLDTCTYDGVYQKQ